MSAPGVSDFDRRHRHARERLTVYAAGLLPEAQEEALLAHLVECPDCQSTLDEMAGAGEWEAPAGQHVPAALLSRWPVASAQLHGLERSLVESHLAACEQCREELAVLGHPAQLSPETRVNLVDLPAREAEPEARRAPARVVTRGSRVDWVRWAFAGWATAATAAAAWLLLLPAAPTVVQVAQHAGGELASIGVLASEPATALVPLPDLKRSASPEALRPVEVPQGQRILFLAPPLLIVDEPAAAVATLEVRAPSDSVLCSTRSTLGALRAARVLPLSTGPRGFLPGEYTLVVRSEAFERYLPHGEQRFAFRVIAKP